MKDYIQLQHSEQVTGSDLEKKRKEKIYSKIIQLSLLQSPKDLGYGRAASS